jgi:hypothetical protein
VFESLRRALHSPMLLCKILELVRIPELIANLILARWLGETSNRHTAALAPVVQGELVYA